jgi:hypothetical protein
MRKVHRKGRGYEKRVTIKGNYEKIKDGRRKRDKSE